MTNQAILELLEQNIAASGIDICVYAPNDMVIDGKTISHGTKMKMVLKSLGNITDLGVADGKVYVKVEGPSHADYYVSCKDDKVGNVVAKMTAIEIQKLLEEDDAIFDRDNFFKNILLDNLLLVDIYNQANRLDIPIKENRIAYLIELRERESAVAAVSVLQSMFEKAKEHYIIPIGEKTVVLLRNIKAKENDATIRKTADTILDTLTAEIMAPVRIAYGNAAEEIRHVANSYKEAKIALSVGKIFNPEEKVMSYGALGIGRLIYQLPLPMCKLFIEEIFKGNSPEQFSDERIQTINSFFENNLNVSQTSEALFIHRNTLVYRLNKLEEDTGLNLRSFDDAITFKIALMVVKYMKYMEDQKL